MVVGGTCPFRCFALCAKGALLWGEWETWLLGVTGPLQKLSSAYLRLSSLVLHFSLLFQGGVEFPTGGKSGGAKGVPWRGRSACGRADESATRVCVGSHAG